MGCKNWDKGQEACEEIEKKTGILNHLEILELNFSSLKSVREFANQYNNSRCNIV